MRSLLALATVLVLGPGVAWAQPTFDCAMASSPVERAICRNDQLVDADRELTAAYAALMDRLAGPAKEHLIKDQVRWLDDRAKACIGEIAAVTRCLTTRCSLVSAHTGESHPCIHWPDSTKIHRA